MKKFLTTISLLTLTFLLKAQVPQAICYQAVATDQRGNELVSQAIKVKLSILKGSSAGAEEWIEEHNVTTDGFGLFDLTIGNGQRQGGAQIFFKDIKWGSDKYFLKVEMDITGGRNFILMGTNQMVSVPYALYAERAGSAINADTAKIAIRTDSAHVAGFAWLADSVRRSNTSVTAITAVTAITSINSRRSDTSNIAIYARRSDTANIAITANFARRSDTAQFAWLADSTRRAGFAQNAANAQTANFANNARRADTASFAWNAAYARRSDTAQFAWLADSTRRAAYAYSAGRANLADSARRAGFATRAANADMADIATLAHSAIDDRDRDPINEIQNLSYDSITSIIKLSKPGGQYDQINIGASALRAAGASIDYPFGILGEALLITSNFTVPNNKTLFISAVNNPVVLADGKQLAIEPGMPIVPSGTVIQSCFCSGILINNQEYANPVILDFSIPNFEYEVPLGYYLIVKSGTANRDMSFVIDGTNFSFFSGANSSPRLPVIPELKRIRKGIANTGVGFVVTGYLLKK